jgi:hypothetical protein
MLEARFAIGANIGFVLEDKEDAPEINSKRKIKELIRIFEEEMGYGFHE